MNPDRWKQVSRIYGAALVKQGPERGPYLDHACASDPELRLEVEALLAESREGDTPFDRPVAAVAADVLGDNLVGRRLGPYQLDSLIGAGGMGQVYRATDTRLHRTVAVKVLAPALADDAQFRARFEREAKSIAALNHPHICTLHDVGHELGTSFLVMELVEGESLSHRLERGRLPFEQALTIASQIAEALAAAHKQGIIHRDLKPGNVMLAKTGAKLLDFGLAKSGPAEAGHNIVTVAPTRTTPLTEQGTILGTFQYMAPEQLEGNQADARTDIFAFGAVMYELFTGQKAFDGKSQASLIGAIMHAEPPPMTASQPLAPPALERVVRKALAKDPDNRWQSARDLADELRWVSDAKSEAPSVPPAQLRTNRPWMLAGIVTGIAGLVMAAWLWRTPTTVAPEDRALVRFNIVPPPGNQWSQNPGGGAAPIAVSPDGRWLTYGVTHGGGTSLWLRALDSLTARELPGTEGARYPFWSPDSRTVAFLTQNQIKRVEVAGGPAQTLGDLENGLGGSWGRNGTIIVGALRQGLFRLTERGGPIVKVNTKFDSDPRMPLLLADGRHFVAVVNPSDERRQPGLFLGDLQSDDAVKLPVDDARGVGYAQGQLLFVRGQTLFAQAFDERTFQISGRAEPLAEDVGSGPNGSAGFSVSTNGVLAYAPSLQPRRQLSWKDRAGALIARIGEPVVVNNIHVSVDGRRILATRLDPRTGTPTLWLIDTERNNLQTPVGLGGSGYLSPDGTRIVSNTQQPVGLQLNTVATQATEPLVPRRAMWATDWAADGRFVIVQHPEARTNFDVSALDLTTRELRPLLQSTANEAQGRLSPDQRWLAYSSDVSGRPEIYVRSFPELGEPVQVSTDGGVEPHWRHDTKELFYLSINEGVTAVAIHASGGRPTPGPPTALFPVALPARSPFFSSSFVPVGDGSRFLVNELVDPSATNDITVILNWRGLLPAQARHEP